MPEREASSSPVSYTHLGQVGGLYNMMFNRDDMIHSAVNFHGCGLPYELKEEMATEMWGCLLYTSPMKSELLVIADQHAAENAFPGLVHTARHTTRVVCTRSRRPNRKGGGAEGVEGEGGEVVTR